MVFNFLTQPFDTLRIYKEKVAMKKVIILGVTLFVVIFAVISCSIDDDDNPATCEELYQNLDSFRIDIEQYAASSICSNEFECRYIAFGEKPCGGPWKYLIYTTSIDTVQLESAVADYNEREANYNQSCGAVSDCSVPTPPTGFTCENNQCIPIF